MGQAGGYESPKIQNLIKFAFFRPIGATVSIIFLYNTDQWEIWRWYIDPLSCAKFGAVGEGVEPRNFKSGQNCKIAVFRWFVTVQERYTQPIKPIKVKSAMPHQYTTPAVYFRVQNMVTIGEEVGTGAHKVEISVKYLDILATFREI